MTEERTGMGDPAMRLTHWLAGTSPNRYDPRNDVRATLTELVRLRKKVEAAVAELDTWLPSSSSTKLRKGLSA